MKRQPLLRLGIPVLAAGLLAFAILSSTAHPTREATIPAVPPATSPFTAAVAGLGVVEPNSELITVGTHLPGVVKTVHVRVGQKVRKGEALFAIDDRDARAPAAIIARRPDLKRAERELAVASALTAAATAELYPKVTLGGLFGYRDVGGGPSGIIWSIAGGLTAPLINFGRLEAQVDIADARRQQRYYAYRQAVLLAIEEVETVLTAYVNSGRNVESLDRLIENEQRKLALAEERYRKGLSPFIDVLDAQRSLYAAQTDRVLAASEHSRGYIALNKAVGG